MLGKHRGKPSQPAFQQARRMRIAGARESPLTALAVKPCALRILLVEDNADLCQLVCNLLEHFGHMPVAVESAEAALLRLADAQFDVLLTDVSLPGMSGIELARKVLPTNPQMHIIFASGYGASVTAHLGFVAHSLLKPYDIEQLQALLNSLGT